MKTENQQKIRIVKNQKHSKKYVDGIIRRSNSHKNILVNKENSFFKKNVRSSLKMISVSAVIFILFIGLSRVGSTVSYFNDIEISTGNKLQAGVLGFNISSLSDVVGRLSVAAIEGEGAEEEYKEESNVGKEEFNITVLEDDESLPAVYTVRGELDPANPRGCDKMNVEANIEEYNYTGLFSLFNYSSVSSMGEWQFVVSLPEINPELPPSAICKGKVVFQAGLADVAPELVHTFSDEKSYDFEIENWKAKSEEVVAPVLDSPVVLPEVPPQNSPTDPPADPPADIPSDAPSDTPTDTPGDAPADVPSDTPTETPAEDGKVSVEEPIPQEEVAVPETEEVAPEEEIGATSEESDSEEAPSSDSSESESDQVE